MKILKIIAISFLLSTSLTAYAFIDEVDNTNILVEQAVNHIYQKRYKQAHSVLKEAYEKSPRHPGVHFNLGRLFELTGNYEEALKEYKIASSLDQTMIAAKRGIARCSVELKKVLINNPNIPVGQQPIPNTPNTVPVITQKASNGQNKIILPNNPYPIDNNSVSGFQPPIIKEPVSSNYQPPVVKQSVPSNNQHQAKKQPVSSAPVVSQNTYTPKSDAIQTSKIYSSTNNLDLPPLPQIIPTKTSKSSSESKAESLLDKGNTDEAIKIIDTILEKNPDSAEAHYLMGKALSVKNNLFGSIKHLEEAVRVDEKCYDAYYLLGKNYAKVNLMEDAINNYLIYYNVRPQANVAVEIAKIYENLGNQIKANEFYTRANSLNPGNSNLQMQVNESSVSLANDLYLKANHAFSINQFREAANYFTQAISTNRLPEAAKRDAMNKLEIAKFRINQREEQIAPMKQGFAETRKNFAPTSLKYYQLADINYKNNFTNAIYTEWTGYIAKKITRYGRDFLLMIKECDRDELEYMNKTYNDYKLNKHYNNQPVFLLMTSKGGFPDFMKEKTMITFTGKTDWQLYEVVNDMGSTIKLPTFEYISAYPVRQQRR